jgi:hypothetical protein
MACGVLLIIVVIVAGALAFPRLLSLVSMPIEPTGIARAARTATPVLPTRVPAVIVVTATPPPGAPTEPPPPPQTQPPPPPQTQPAPPPTQPSPLPPTEPLLPTRTLVPASPTPTVVLASFGCPGASGNSLFFDDFGNPESGWTVYRGADYEHFYEDGEFHFNVFRTNTLGHSWMLLKDLGTRYRIEVQGRKLGGPNMNDYGLLFGGQSDITYDAFLISDTGSYQVFKKVEGQRYDLATWTKTPFVNQGGLNFLGVKVEGTQFTVCLNGQVLTTMNDPALKSGRVGMIAGAFDEPVHIHFDNFGVWKLD